MITENKAHVKHLQKQLMSIQERQWLESRNLIPATKKNMKNSWSANDLLHPDTQLIQERRAAILSHLTAAEDSSVATRRSSMRSLPALAIDVDMESQSDVMSSTKSIWISQLPPVSPTRRKRFSPPLYDMLSHKAQWDDYDIMKSRWGYVFQQTRQLLPDEDMIVPTCSSPSRVPQVEVALDSGDSVSITGSLVDANRFTEVTRNQYCKSLTSSRFL